MANTIITPNVMARAAMLRLTEAFQVAPLVNRDYEADFTGQQGDTITVRRPAEFTTNEFDRPTGIVLQDVTESSFTVELDTVPDVSFAVTAEELTLDVDAFGERFLDPAAEAIAQYIDSKILAVASAGIVQTVGVDAVTPTDPYLLVDMGKILNDNNVPRQNRHTVLNTAAEAEFAKSGLFSEADKRGDTEGIRDASIGYKFGWDNHTSTNLPAGNDSLGFHRDAISLVTRTLAAPMGVAPNQVATVNYKGFGLRVVYGYDQSKKQDVVSIDALIGVKMLDADKGIKLLG